LRVVGHDADDVTGMVGGGHAREGDPETLSSISRPGLSLCVGAGLAGDL